MGLSQYVDAPGAHSIKGIEPDIGVTDLNPKKILLVAPLQSEGPDEPEEVPVKQTASLKKVFEYAQPCIEEELETGDEDEPTEDVKIDFENLSAFQPVAIVRQIPLLQRLSLQEDAAAKLLGEIEKNRKLRDVLQDKEKKEALIEVLQSILQEL